MISPRNAAHLDLRAFGTEITLKKRLARGLLGIAMALSVAIGLITPTFWGDDSGRDFRPQATVMAILFVLAGSAFRGIARWDLKDFATSLIIANLVTLAAIGHFSGYTGSRMLDSFNLWWLVLMNIFIGLPWAVGFWAGSAVLWTRNKKGPNNTSEIGANRAEASA